MCLSLRPDLRTALVLIACAVPLTAQDFAELTGAGLPRDLEPTARVCAVDVDADTDLDLIIARDAPFPGAALVLYENDGDANFTVAAAGKLPTTRTVVGGIIAGDVDGDGDADLVIAGRDLQSDLLFVNDGRGNFRDVSATALPAALFDTRAVAMADLDGDGDQDLVFADSGAPDRVLANDGSGTFTLLTSFPTGPFDRPIAIAVLDGDLDGRLEILITETIDRDRYWVRGSNGQWTDLAADRLPGHGAAATAVVPSDVDRDGDADLIVGLHGAADLLLRNDGFGKFVSELLVPGGGTPAQTSSLAVADLDGDQDVDIVVGELDARDHLLWNDGSGTFGVAGPGFLDDSVGATVDVLAVDLQGDGDADVVTVESAGLAQPSRKRMWRNDGTGVLRSETRVGFDAPNLDTTDFAPLDIDGDGALDLFIGRPGLADELWFGDGNGRLKPFPVPAIDDLPDATMAVAGGDIDNDGDVDLLAIGAASQHLFRNNGSRVFVDVGASSLPLDGADVRDLVLADFDGDGWLDAYVVHAGPSPAFADPDSLWMNDGTGRLVDQPNRLPNAAWIGYAASVGDVDGDGDVDLLVGNRTVLPGLLPDQPDQLLLNDGSGNFTAAPLSQFPHDGEPTTDVELIDVDADGDLDAVAVGGQALGRVLRNDGSGNFTLDPAAMPAVPLFAVGFAVVDRDLDGDPDLVVGQRDAPNLILVNDGSGNFSLAPPSVLSDFRDATETVAAGDFDGDGDDDLLIGNRRGQKDFLLYNLERHVSAPTRARIGANYELVIHAGQPGAARAAAVWMGFALAPAGIPVGGLGLFRLDPALTFRAGTVNVAPNEREIRVIGALPNSASAIGFPFHVQAMVFPAIDPFGGGFTQVVSETIGR